MATIDFDLTTLGLTSGTHTIKTKANADGFLSSEFSNAITYTKGELTDELAGTWVINSDRFKYPITTDSYNSSFDLNVTIDGVSYKSIVFSKFISSTDFDDGWIYAYHTDDSSGTTLYAYEPDQHEITTGWVNESYKTWAITSNLADVTNGDALLAWLQANATKQEEAEITNIVINNATYTTEVGMTWADWANSAYNTDSLTLTTPIYGIINSELVSKSSSDPMVEGYYALGASAILFNQDARGDSTSMEIVVTDDKGNVAARANSPVVNGSRAQASAFHNNLSAQIPAGALSYAQTYGEYMTATITTAPVADNQQVKLIAINEYNGVRQIFEGDFSSTSSSITITPEQSHFGITITPITGSSSYNVTQDGGGGDWQYVIIYKSSIISFTIDGTEYQAEEGMTWAEWCESDYNTNNFYLKEDINTLFTADDKEIFYDGNSIIGTYEIIANGVYTIAESEDELAGTWVFNDQVTLWYGGYYLCYDSGLSDSKYYFTFVSNGVTYDAISCWLENIGVDGQIVYNEYSNVWYDTAYQTITITSNLADVVDKDGNYAGDALLAWLQANATKQSSEEEATYSITYNLTGVTADGGNPSTIQSGDSATLRFTSTVGNHGNWEITATNATTSNFTDPSQWLSNGTTFGCDISNPTRDIIVTVLAASGPEAI